MCEKNNIAAYKVILKNEGVISCTNMRRPLEKLPREDEEALLNKLAAVDYKNVII